MTKPLDILSDVTDDIGELAEITPYVKSAIAGYKKVRELRAKRFSRSQNIAGDSLGEGKSRKLKQWIESTTGQSVLGEYCDVVLGTSSETAICAIALIYADSQDEIYDSTFKRRSVYALSGISEVLIDDFMVLSDFPDSSLAPPGPYPVYKLRPGYTDLPNLIRERFPDFEAATFVVGELTRRQLLLADHASSRLGSSDGPDMTFGAGDFTRRIRELLGSARKLLEQDAA